MSTFGFTGTGKGMTLAQFIATKVLFERLEVSVLHHGDCFGADAQAHRLAVDRGAMVVIHPPTDPKHRAFCGGLDTNLASGPRVYQGVTMVVKPPFAYLTRDRHIVQAADGMIATPKDFHKPTNYRGQGTWTTVRYAQQAGRPIWVVFPDGSIKVSNGGGELQPW